MTDEKIDLANTWAEELGPDVVNESAANADMSLTMSRAYPTDVSQSPDQEGAPSGSAGVQEPFDTRSESAELGDSIPEHLLMPKVPDLDAITLRRSQRVRNKRSANCIKRLFSFFTMFSLAIATTLSTVFNDPRTTTDRAMAHMSLVNQHFDGTLLQVTVALPLCFASICQGGLQVASHPSLYPAGQSRGSPS